MYYLYFGYYIINNFFNSIFISSMLRIIFLNKLPYQIIVGDKEMAANLVAVRTRGGQDLGQMPLETLIERLLGEVATRSGTA